MRSVPLKLLLAIMLFACSKSGNNPPEDENVIIKNNDAVKTIFITYPIHGPGGFTAVFTLAAYDAAGNVKWKRDGVRPISDLTYANGVLAFVTDSSIATSNGTQILHSLYGVNAETGNIVWSNRPSSYLHSNSIARNDTLFVVSRLPVSPYTPLIIVFNMNTGAELFKIPIRDNLSPRFLALDGRLIYYIAHSDYGQVSMVAYDFKAGKEMWQVPISSSNTALLIPSDIIQNDNYLYVTNGVGILMAIEKSTGSLRWSKKGGYLNPKLGNSLIFASEDGFGVHALNPGTGDPAWKWETNEPNGFIENLFYGSGHLFLNYTKTERILTSLNAKTGKPDWERSAGMWPGQPLLVGDKLYFAELGTNSGKLLCLDANTGVLLNSFPLPGDHSAFRNVYMVTESGKFLAPDRSY